MRIDRHAAGVGTNVQSGAYAVVADADDRVLILRAANGRFYLPGGRIEPGETPEQALAREILEECGCEARVGARLGNVPRHRRSDSGDHPFRVVLPLTRHDV